MENTGKKKMSLGRGLGSLLGDEAILEDPQKIRMIQVTHIHPNPNQPRKYFSEEAMAEMVTSIREQGVLQPLLVRTLETGSVTSEYQIVAGERRWRASVAAGLTEIPCMVRELTDQQVLEISLLENIQREDLNPVEIAAGLQRLMTEFDYTHKKIAERIGKNRITITNYLRILKLPEVILHRIRDGEISMGHAKALLTAGEENPKLPDLAERVVNKQLSVRETERLAQELADQAEEEEEKTKAPGNRRKDPTIVVMETNLSQALATPVTITHVHGKGRIVLEYHSLETLEKIASRLMPQNQPDARPDNDSHGVSK